LKKEGINTLDKVTMDENQERRVIKHINKEEFYSFWKNLKKYIK